MQSVLVDCSTGSVQVVPLSATQAADFQAMQQAQATADLATSQAAQQQILQRAADAAESLNSPAVRDTQARRDSFARLIGVRPVSIPLAQDAVASDIAFLAAA